MPRAPARAGPRDSRTFRDAHAIVFAEELLPGLRGPGRDRGDRRPARLPRGRRRPGDPLRHPRATPTPTTRRAHRLARPRGGDQRRRHVPRAGAPARGADHGQDRVILRNGLHIARRPARVRPPRRAGRRRRRAAASSRATASGSATTTSACGTSSPRSASSTRRPPSGCGPRRRCATLDSAAGGRAGRAQGRAAPLPARRASAGWRFLWESGLGGILADDMGLGKTLQTLALVAHARERGAGPVPGRRADQRGVAPGRTRPRTFTPGLDVRVVTESQARRGDVGRGAGSRAPTSSSPRTPCSGSRPTTTSALTWGGLVLDEAQTVKNHHGKTYQACAGSTSRSGWRSPARRWRTG